MSHDLSRYHRQTLLPGFGEDGQKKLLASSALIVGCGALGTVIANMLARAGVGHLIIADRDYIEMTNLQRQVLFDEDDVRNAIPKAEAAKQKIARINSQVKVDAIVDDVNHTNIEKFMHMGGPRNGETTGGSRAEAGRLVDIVIDGVDNFETRFIVNDAAVKHRIPYVYGGAVGTVGMCYAVLPHSAPDAACSAVVGASPVVAAASSPRVGAFSDTPCGEDAAAINRLAPWELLPGGSKATPCLRCIFEQAPPPGMNPTCDTAGVLGPVVSIVSNYQAVEALKILTGNYAAVSPTLLSVDVWSNHIHQFKVAKAYDVGDCQCCKHRNFEFLAGKLSSSTTTLCGRNSVQLTHAAPGSGENGNKINFDEIAARLRAHGAVTANKFMLRAEVTDNGEPYEITLFTDGRAIVKGTKEPRVAKSIYAKYVGA